MFTAGADDFIFVLVNSRKKWECGSQKRAADLIVDGKFNSDLEVGKRNQIFLRKNFAKFTGKNCRIFCPKRKGDEGTGITKNGLGDFNGELADILIGNH